MFHNSPLGGIIQMWGKIFNRERIEKTRMNTILGIEGRKEKEIKNEK
ncbi:MAG: hypothetical protein GY757_23440 [bacterium]|nr:hypothetical protein [bacterium]